jgi:hypothetical protein
MRKNRAASELAKRRAKKLSPERRQEIARQGGRAWWDGLSDKERAKAIARMQKGRKRK